MHTEAAHRFERGADPEAPPLATRAHRAPARRRSAPARRARASSTATRARSRGARCPSARARVPRSWARRSPPPTTRAHPRPASASGWGSRRATRSRSRSRPGAATCRREVDLVEEVGRHTGLTAHPVHDPARGRRGGPAARRSAATAPCATSWPGPASTRSITYSFVPAGGPVARGPRAGQPAVRGPGGAARRRWCGRACSPCCARTCASARATCALFEIGRVFRRATARPASERRLGSLLAGAARRPSGPSEAARGRLLRPEGRAGAAGRAAGPRRGWRSTARRRCRSSCIPGKAARVRLGGRRVGYAGALHPDRAAEWERARRGASSPSSTLRAAARRAPRACASRALPRYPGGGARPVGALRRGGVRRRSVEARGPRGGGPAPARSATVTDRYEGPPVPAGA